MKELILLRHAKSSWKHENLNDIERPLSKIGFAEMVETKHWIKKHSVHPELIYCSPSVRTYQTYLMAAQAAKWNFNKLILNPYLYESSLSDYLKIIKQTNNLFNSIMIVGHNPVITHLSVYISQTTNEILTGSLQIIRLNIKTWKDIRRNCGTLANQFIPSRHKLL